MTIDRAALAALLDHTLLKPEATVDDVLDLCQDAAELGVAAACVSPTMVPVVAAFEPRGFAVCTVVGFPSGAHVTGLKTAEASWAEAEGADELDMVINLGLAKEHDWAAVGDDIADVRRRGRRHPQGDRRVGRADAVRARRGRPGPRWTPAPTS